MRILTTHPSLNPMRIALIHNAKFPVQRYGGTERVVWWLAKGLYEMGCDVTLVSDPKTQCPFAKTLPIDESTPVEHYVKETDVYHYFNTPGSVPTRPYLVTIGGNGKAGEEYLKNTVFVSKDCATRHGAEAYVYNGLDPNDYKFSKNKENYFTFLAKTSWVVKNVSGAIALAKKKHTPLKIMGGYRPRLNPFSSIYWMGMVGNPEKATTLSHSRALLFPIIWNEPFGYAVIEALCSGTPVIATHRGAMPELLNANVGFLCHTEEDFLNAMDEVSDISPDACRDLVLSKFTYQKMAEDYLNLYEKVISGKDLNTHRPTCRLDQGSLIPWGCEG